MSWLRARPGGVSIAIAAQPNAKKTEVIGLHGDALKVRVASPPVEGAANEALIEFLAEALGVKRRDVSLVRGATSRQKVFEVQGVGAEAARAALSP
jgi:uncharacterized protein (TIGR00251 family)